MSTKNYEKRGVIFFGSGTFSMPSLEKLYLSDYEIRAVVTQPDKPFGRGKINTENIIKKWCVKNNIPVLQPKNVNEPSFIEKIRNLNFDIGIVSAYGKIIPKTILEIPSKGFLNVHGSLLPKYRGASPIQAAILNGDKTTGATIMLLDEGLDTGPTLAMKQVQIDPTDNGQSLEKKVALIGANLLMNIIDSWFVNKIIPLPQETKMESMTKKITKLDGKINWHDTSITIDRIIRAYYPWPTGWTLIPGSEKDILQIHTAKPAEAQEKYTEGTIFFGKSKQLCVACGKGTILELGIIQPSGKNPMASLDYINGHRNLLLKKFE